MLQTNAECIIDQCGQSTGAGDLASLSHQDRIQTEGNFFNSHDYQMLLLYLLGINW